LSLLLLLAAAALAFLVLLTVSERFFCPALELISDYLRLPPVVAGATLLSFGNGAPDTFTQVAAIGQVRLCWQQKCKPPCACTAINTAMQYAMLESSML
jgi:hypothetical protein